MAVPDLKSTRRRAANAKRSSNGAHANGAPDRLPPHSSEAEQGALGCILLDPNCLRTCMEAFGSAASMVFYDVRNQRIYQCFLDLQCRNSPIDVISVQQHLRDRHTLDDAGGLSYLGHLPDCTPSPLNLPHYTDILLSKWKQRAVIKAATEAVARAFEAPLTETDSIIETLSQSLIDVSWNNRHGLPDIIDSTDLTHDEELKDPKELVRGLFHQGTKLALGGGSKTCKTWVLLDLGLSVSHNTKFLGFDVTPGPVLYLNLEIGKSFFRKRIMRVAKEKGIELKPGMFDVWNLRGFNAPFEELIPKIMARIKKAGYVLIILDPIYKIYGNLDENKAGDISRLMTGLESLSMSTAAALAFGAHFSKGNQAQKEAMDRMSGSGVFARDPDTIITLTAHDEKDCFVVESTLRNLPPIKPFVVRWNYPMMKREDALNPDELKKPGGRPKTYDTEAILHLLDKKALSTSDWQKLASQELGVSRSGFFRARDELHAAKRILKQAASDTWTIVLKLNDEPPED